MAQANSNNTVIRSGIGRRSFVAALAGGAAFAASTHQAAATADAELINLAKEISELRKEYDAASAVECERYDDFKRLQPERPTSLLWGACDPVGYSDGDYYEENGKRYLWCRFGDIEKLRGKIQYQWTFVGTDEQALDLKVAELRNADLPLRGYEHLWEKMIDKRRQKRALRLIKAYDEYMAAQEAARIASGYEEASNVTDAIMEKLDAVYDRMTELDASTLEGVRAQAVGLVMAAWDGEIRHPEYQQDFMLARMMSALTGIPVQPEKAPEPESPIAVSSSGDATRWSSDFRTARAAAVAVTS
jgi:hypothetical protein